MSHPCSFHRKSWSGKLNYPNQKRREAGKVTAVTVGVCNPRNVGLVSNDASYCGMFNDVTQKTPWGM